MPVDVVNTPPLLRVDNLNVSLSGRTVLDNVSFDLRPGDFCGLIGSNGAGKTTLLRAILGLQKFSSGQILFNGKPLKSGSADVSYVPQKSSIDPDLPLRARDLVALGLDGNRLGLPLGSGRRQQRVDEILNAVGAESFANQRLGNLSGGQQQRILIAHALIKRPRLLLLDEPLANLDISSIADIVHSLGELCRQHEVSLLLSAHDMNPLMKMMTRTVYLANGKAVSGETSDVVQPEVLTKLYGYPINVVRNQGQVFVAAAMPE